MDDSKKILVFTYPKTQGVIARNTCEALLQNGYICEFNETEHEYFIHAKKGAKA